MSASDRSANATRSSRLEINHGADSELARSLYTTIAK